jgi:hypothetical protein
MELDEPEIHDHFPRIVDARNGTIAGDQETIKKLKKKMFKNKNKKKEEEEEEEEEVWN